MIKASDLKKGGIVKINGAPHILEELSISTPSARGASSLYRMRFRNLITKQKYDGTYKGDDALEDISFDRRAVQFSYVDQDRYVFTDLEDYSEIHLTEDMISEQKLYLTDAMEDISVFSADGRVLGIELPPTVVLKVVETGPSMKGASATARTKPATLSTGLVVQVPEYLGTGELIRVDTRTGKFLGRA